MVLRNQTPSITIEHLPTELLVEIIRQLRSMIGVTPPWFHTTFVCHRWRTIILGYAPFWTRIETTNLEQATAYLERSKISPIDLTVTNFPPDEDQRRVLTSLLSPHIHRTKVLSVGVQHVEDLIRYLGISFPILEIFCVLPGSDDIPYEIHISLDAPCIHQLRVSQATLDWESTLYKNLKSLWLLFAFEILPTIHKFLDVLEACPLLSVLYLADFSLDNPEIPVTQETRSIRLQHLEECHIGGTRSDVATLLRHINIPSCESFSIDFRPSSRAQKCSNLWVLPQDTSSRFPFIRDSTNVQLEIDLPRTATSADPKFLNQKCDVRVDLSFGDDDSSAFSVSFPAVSTRLRPVILDSAIAFVQPFAITTLVVAYDFENIHTSWETTLLKFPRLKSLTVIAITYDAVQSLRAAKLYAALSFRSTSHQVVCPNLEELYLFRFKLNSTLVDLLRSILDIRALLGSRLRSLDIEDWYPMEEVRHVWPDFSNGVDEFSESERSLETF